MILKKLNWGWKIGIMYALFVMFILFMVYKAVNMKTELVTKDYYAEELRYQEQIDKMNRSNALKEKMEWKIIGKEVRFLFPVKEVGRDVKAEVYFYRPNSSAQDFTATCVADTSGRCSITSEKFRHGIYKMQVNWKSGDETYFDEGIININ